LPENDGRSAATLPHRWDLTAFDIDHETDERYALHGANTGFDATLSEVTFGR
jgi:hypothetical protein